MENNSSTTMYTETFLDLQLLFTYYDPSGERSKAEDFPQGVINCSLLSGADNRNLILRGRFNPIINFRKIPLKLEMDLKISLILHVENGKNAEAAFILESAITKEKWLKQKFYTDPNPYTVIETSSSFPVNQGENINIPLILHLEEVKDELFVMGIHATIPFGTWNKIASFISRKYKTYEDKTKESLLFK
jgi:hypothetical protein